MSATDTTAPTAAVYSATAGRVVWRGQCLADAIEYAARQNKWCAKRGGYGDRHAYTVDADGYLRDEQGRHVWPSHGRSAGAVRI